MSEGVETVNSAALVCDKKNKFYFHNNNSNNNNKSVIFTRYTI